MILRFCMRLLPALAAALLQVSSPVVAAGDPTDGHTHAEDEAVAATAGPPMAEADGSLYEVVLELVDDHILLWVDDRATNAPATKARLTVSIGGKDLPVQPVEPGTFRVDLPDAPTQAFAVALAIESPAGADLLETTLRPAEAPAEAHDHPLDWRSAAIGAGAVLGIFLLAFAGSNYSLVPVLSKGLAVLGACKDNTNTHLAKTKLRLTCLVTIESNSHVTGVFF